MNLMPAPSQTSNVEHFASLLSMHRNAMERNFLTIMHSLTIREILPNRPLLCENNAFSLLDLLLALLFVHRPVLKLTITAAVLDHSTATAAHKLPAQLGFESETTHFALAQFHSNVIGLQGPLRLLGV